MNPYNNTLEQINGIINEVNSEIKEKYNNLIVKTQDIMSRLDNSTYDFYEVEPVDASRAISISYMMSADFTKKTFNLKLERLKNDVDVPKLSEIIASCNKSSCYYEEQVTKMQDLAERFHKNGGSNNLIEYLQTLLASIDIVVEQNKIQEIDKKVNEIDSLLNQLENSKNKIEAYTLNSVSEGNEPKEQLEVPAADRKKQNTVTCKMCVIQ